MSQGDTWRWLSCKLKGDSNTQPTELLGCLCGHHLPHRGRQQTRPGLQLVQPRLIIGKVGALGHKASMQPAPTIICSTAAMLASVVILGLLSGSVISPHPGKSQRPKLTEGQECAREAGGEGSSAHSLGTAPKAFKFRFSCWV